MIFRQLRKVRYCFRRTVVRGARRAKAGKMRLRYRKSGRDQYIKRPVRKHQRESARCAGRGSSTRVVTMIWEHGYGSTAAGVLDIERLGAASPRESGRSVRMAGRLLSNRRWRQTGNYRADATMAGEAHPMAGAPDDTPLSSPLHTSSRVRMILWKESRHCYPRLDSSSTARGDPSGSKRWDRHPVRQTESALLYRRENDGTRTGR